MLALINVNGHAPLDSNAARARGADGGAGATRSPPALSRETLSASAEATLLSAIEAWRLDRDDSHDGAVVVALRRLREALRLGCRAFSAARAEQAADGGAEQAAGERGAADALATPHEPDAVAGLPLEAHALGFLRLFELQPDVSDLTVVAEMLSMLELADDAEAEGSGAGAAHALPPPISARLLAAVAAHRGAVVRALAADTLIHGGLRALGPLQREHGTGAPLPPQAAAAMGRFVRRVLALSARRLPSDASAAQLAREVLAIVGLKPALAHALRADARDERGGGSGASAQLLRATEAELARLRAAGASGRVWWSAHASKLPFGGLAPLRASALLRACAAPPPDGAGTTATAGGDGRVRRALTADSAAAVARCDANDFALALAAVLHAAGARVRLRASCDRGPLSEPAAGTVCSLAAEVPVPVVDAVARGAGCAAGDCEWVLVPAAYFPPEALAAGANVAFAARRAESAATGGRGDAGGVWLALEWGAQALARAIVADNSDELVWLVDGQRAEPADDEHADAPASRSRAQVDVTFCATDDARAEGTAECVGPLGAVAAAADGGAEAGQPAYKRVWLVCEGCVPAAGAVAPSDACVCRVEGADLEAASRPADDGGSADARLDAADGARADGPF